MEVENLDGRAVRGASRAARTASARYARHVHVPVNMARDQRVADDTCTSRPVVERRSASCHVSCDSGSTTGSGQPFTPCA